MKRIGIVIAAMAALVVGAAPLAAQAAAAKLPPITQKQRDQGKAEAPAAVAAAKLTCNVQDAYFIQESADPKTKVKSKLFEVACAEGPGYVVQAVADNSSASAYDCLAQEETAARTPGSLTCRLDANADAKAGYAKMLTAMGHPCTATGARVMGATATGDQFYEVACGAGEGFVIQTSPGKAPEASPCIQFLGGGASECTLTTKASIMSGLGEMATKAGKPCTVSDGRLVGSGSGSTFYEVACGADSGFMIQAKADKTLDTIDCSKAQPIGGGCTLTVVNETAEAGTYTKLAQAAAYPCEVSKYRYLGKETKTNSEIVELACNNRPDGAIALFPIGDGKAQVFDCIQGGSLGVACQLTQPTAVYAKYTDKLVAQGKNQCKVSGAKYLASTTNGSDFIETACSDGLPGFVISVDHSTGAVKELLTCGQAQRSGAACTLPTNIAKN
ncbi:MAG: hypothetical protein B7Z12_06905 [Caulobacter vibrioides]|uniref:Uncharacterized protein n=1 Tax=Caulobacter vibrioides TaxID=155892 RepID=A0A258D9A4_CAUVI|nr:MAG: hypothetical protein B7Z12_06905 [Caulobacter vibrioides]